jgi:hypothetical protein
VWVVIEDDGIGFDVVATEHGGPRQGLGLVGMRERVSQLGGTIRIDSAPRQGTRLVVELPVRERPETPTDPRVAPAAKGVAAREHRDESAAGLVSPPLPAAREVAHG